MWWSTKPTEAPPGRVALVVAAIAIGVAAFLLIVGLGPSRLPFPANAPYSDAAVTHWPNALYLKQHPFALWNPRIMSGLPFAANPLSKVWYPPQWLVYLLPPTLHLNVAIGLHLTLGGAGMWAWARATGMRPGPATLAAAAYTFAPKVIAHLGAGHLDLVYAAGWFPWVMWAVHRLTVTDTNIRRGLLRLGAIAALMLLADIRLSFFAFATADAYGLWLIWRRHNAGARHAVASQTRTCIIHLLVTVNVVTLALTAVQWVPLVALAPYLSRGGLTPEDAAEFALKPGALVRTLIPDRAGNHETMVYAGLVVLVLAMIALLARPRALGFWAAVIAVAALYAMGPKGLIWPVLIRLFPPLLWLRVPSRAWFVAAMALPYLAGWGVQILTVPTKERVGARVRLAIAALLGGVVMCSVGSLIVLTGELGVATTVTALIVAVATAAVVGLALACGVRARHAPAGQETVRRALEPHAIITALIVIVLIDLVGFDLTLVEGRGPAYWLDPYAELAEYLLSADAGRVYSPSYSLPQQAAAHWGINLFGGVDPFQIQSYVEMSERATGIPRDGYSPTIPPYTGEGEVETMWAGITPDAELMSLWNVTHTVSAFPIEGEGWRFDRRVGDVYVYENTYRVETQHLIWPLPDGATAFTSEASSLTLVSVPRVPGWGGKDTHEPDALTRFEYPLSPPLTKPYIPLADFAGIAISAGALIAWVVLFWRGRRRGEAANDE